MVFAHDTELSLAAAADLVNTLPGTRPGDPGPDPLTTVDELDSWLDGWAWTGSRAHDRDELDAVRALRPRLRHMWETDEEGVVELVNDLLAEGRALPQLVRHDAFDWHVHATPPEAPLATRIAVEAAMAFVDVIRTGELTRLKLCDAEGCRAVVVDLTKNRSRRFCDDGCANRTHVAAYRARKESADRS